MNIKDLLLTEGTTGYGPVYWTHDPYATTDPTDWTTPAGAVVLLINEDWTHYPDSGRWGANINTFHAVRIVIPAPDGVTDEVIQQIETFMQTLTFTEQNAFRRMAMV